MLWLLGSLWEFRSTPFLYPPFIPVPLLMNNTWQLKSSMDEINSGVTTTAARELATTCFYLASPCLHVSGVWPPPICIPLSQTTPTSSLLFLVLICNRNGNLCFSICKKNYNLKVLINRKTMCFSLSYCVAS
jgi:hypothetical protein